MKHDIPIERKVGYEHMIEMRGIEKELRAEGWTGIELHMAAQKLYQERHKHDLPFRERQRIARENGEAWAGGRPAGPSKLDTLRKALETIRDGHNDPRALAAKVLEEVHG